MLVNLLPGLREVRTPLASGYLLLAFLGIVFADKLRAREGNDLARDIGYLHRIGLGAAGWLAVLSFVAYLTGAAWEGLGWVVGRLVYSAATRESAADGRSWVRLPWCRSDQTAQLRKLADDDAPDGRSSENAVRDLLEELYTAPSKLISTSHELWAEWDRLDAEARFRITVSIPMAVTGAAASFAVSPSTGWSLLAVWVLLLLVMFGLGVSRGRDSTEVLIQALQAGQLGEMRCLPNTRLTRAGGHRPGSRAVENPD